MASHLQAVGDNLPPPLLHPSKDALVNNVKPRCSSSPSADTKEDVEDRYSINERFLQKHEQMFERALREIHNGRKESCWVWFILPTQPYIVDGREVGSRMNRYYALRSDDEVKAYLSMSNVKVNLRQNYIDMVTAIEAQLRIGLTLFDLFGMGDSKKLKSSLQLFSRIAGLMGDTELEHACSSLMEVCKCKPYKKKSKMDRIKNLFSTKKKSKTGPIKNLFSWKAK